MKNKYEIRGEITAVFLTKKDGTIFETLIDTNDLQKVMEFPNTWHLHYNHNGDTYYVRGYYYKPNKKSIRLHNLLVSPPKGKIVDHMNLNTLDNRRENLRVASNAENRQNLNLRKDNKSGIRGVTWCKKHKKWVAYIRVNKILKFLGYYSDKEDAREVVEKARAKCMPFSKEAM